MHRVVRHRSDGIVEIRRSSWRDVVILRDLGTMALLACAWAASMTLLVAGLLASPLLVGVAGLVLVLVLSRTEVGGIVAVTATATEERAPRRGSGRVA